MKKVLLITGASSGLGKETSKQFSKLDDWTIYATARRVGLMDDLKEKGIKIMHLDVTDEAEVNKVVQTIIQKEGRIDALFANAGFGSFGMIEALSIEEIQYQFDVNVFGVARCVKAVLPQMRKQQAGRIVITESISSHISTLGLGWYASSKHALRGMSIALRQEVKDFGIEVISIEPDGMTTEFEQIAFANMKKANHPPAYSELTKDFQKYMSNAYKKVLEPQKVVRDVIEAITSETPNFVYSSGKNSKLGTRLFEVKTDKFYDDFILRNMRRAV